MLVKPKVVAQGVFLSNVAAIVGDAAPTGKQRIISRFSVHNTDTVNRTVNVWIVPSGGATADSTRVERATLLPNETWSIPSVERQVLDSGSAIWAQGEVSNKISVFCSAIEVTS